MTPDELARELGISPKTLRAWLRERYPDHVKGRGWFLTVGMVMSARARFA